MTAHQAFGRIHGDGAHSVLSQMLGDFEDEAVAAILGFERVENFRQLAVELYVDDGARDLAYAPDRPVCCCCGCGVTCHFVRPFHVYLERASTPSLTLTSMIRLLRFD